MRNGPLTFLSDWKFWLALGWLAVAATLATVQAPLAIESRYSAWDLLTHPIERNAAQRLPITSTSLRAVAFTGDGRRGWAVGNGVVFITRDGGANWSPQTIGTAALFQAIAFTPDGQRGWVAGSGGMIITTNDGGANWSAQTSATTKDLSALAFTPDGKRGWAVGDEGAIIVTRDGGVSWSTPKAIGATSALAAVVFTSDGQRGWAVGASGTIVATRDGGVNWLSQTSGTVKNLHAVAFASDGQHGWAVGDDGTIVATSDGGARWSPQVSGTTHWLRGVAFASDGQRGWAIGNDGTIIATRDGGTRWAPQTSGNTDDLNAIAFTPDGERGWAVGMFGTILATGDGGAAWSRQTQGLPITAVAFAADGQRGWAAGLGGMIVATHDRGANWSPQTSGTTDWLNAIAFTPDGERGWAVGMFGTIVATRDGGANWSSQRSGTKGWLRAVTLTADGQRGWAVGDEGIIATRDGGASWSPTKANGSAVHFEAITFTPDGERGWAVGANGAIVATRDGGASWLPQTSGTTQGLNAVAFASDGQHGWAVGSGVILVTSDGGNNWSMAKVTGPADGLGAVGGFTAGTFAPDGQHGWAVGLNGAIVATRDRGENWSPQNSRTIQHLRGVMFASDGQRGWAVGSHGAIVATRDGGATWFNPIPYSRYPAGWFWLSLLPAAAVLRLSLQRREPGATVDSVADVGASDAAIAEIGDDRLDFVGLARGISRFLRNPRTSAPLTLAITGDWGTGKSSLMQLLCADLRRFGHRPIWFNAWHHQQQEQIFAALLGAIRAQAAPPTLSIDGLTFRMKLLWHRSKRHWLLAVGLVATLAFLVAYESQHGVDAGTRLVKWVVRAVESMLLLNAPDAPDSGLLSFIAAIAVTVIACYRGLKAFGTEPAVLLTSVAGRMQVGRAKAQNDFRTEFARELADVTWALPLRLVLVIDDLDRCRPEAVLEVMEVVNFITSAAPCFVIFGMATERVQAALGVAFERIAKEMITLGDASNEAPSEARLVAQRRDYARDYLQKLVNLEIKVPPRDPNRSRAETLLVADAKRDRSDWRELLHTICSPWPIYALVVAAMAGIFASTLVEPSVAPVATEISARPLLAHAPSATGSAAEPKSQLTSTPGLEHPVFAPGASNSVLASWGIFGALGLIVLIAIGLAIVAGLREAARRAVDSTDFRDGLEIWTGFVAARQDTPRAIKRWGNRLRYLAMLQQARTADDTTADTLWRRWHQRWSALSPSFASDAAKPVMLDERQLIMLGALHEVYGQSWESKARAPSHSVHPGEVLLDKCILRHKRKFSGGWPPTKAEMDAFKKLLAGIRVEDEPERIMPAPLTGLDQTPVPKAQAKRPTKGSSSPSAERFDANPISDPKNSEPPE